MDNFKLPDTYEDFKAKYFKNVPESELFKVGNRIYIIGVGCEDEGQSYEIGNFLTETERFIMFERLKRNEILIFIDGGKNESSKNPS